MTQKDQRQMRDYAKVAPQFWMGPTGRQIRACGIDAQLLALYLITCQHANMLGLYYLPIAYIAHDTGLSPEGASKALARLSEVGFAHYDAPSEWVWVVEMARYQIGEALKPDDKRVLGLNRELKALHNCVFLHHFYQKYAVCFHLEIPSPFQGPSKALRSQEQEQEQEQEKNKGDFLSCDATSKKRQKPGGAFQKFWEAYPRKVGKEAARKSWERQGLNAKAPAIIASVAAHASHDPSWQKGFIPNPATYLNQGRWEDELTLAQNGFAPPRASPCTHKGALPVSEDTYNCPRCGTIPEATFKAARGL